MQPNICHLKEWGILYVSGSEAGSFLQGFLTNDVRHVSQEQSLYAAILTPQGRFWHELFVSKVEEGYFLEGRRTALGEIGKKFNVYKLRSQVIVTDISETYDVWAFWGTAFEKNVEGFPSLPGSRLEPSHVPPFLGEKGPSLPSQSLLYRDPRALSMGWRGIVPRHALPSSWSQASSYALWRLSVGIPEEPFDLIPEKSIPLECRLDALNAISWSKGCYLGQELTARTKYRGIVRKKLFKVQSQGFPLPVGTVLYHEGQEVGTLCSSYSDLGLALIRLETVDQTSLLHTKDQQIQIIIKTDTFL